MYVYIYMYMCACMYIYLHVTLEDFQVHIERSLVGFPSTIHMYSWQ